MRSRIRWIFAVANFGSAIACRDFAAEPDPIDARAPDVATVDAGADGDVASVPFGACSGFFSGACATVDMPLDWKNPGGKKIGILLNKIVSTPRPKTQLWLLQGGPGVSASDLVPLGRDLARRQDGLEVFTIEHRGVGASNRLGCPTAEASAQGGRLDRIKCTEEAKALYGDDLRHYTITNAAKDVARAIELTRRDGVKVFVYGGSYGTFWAQRLMQVAPTHASGGVILDSIVVPGETVGDAFDGQADVVAKKLAELCKVNATCSAQMGSDPWAKIVAVRKKLDQGWCPESGVKVENRVFLTNFLRAWPLMGYTFAAIARYDRCNAEDVAALKQLASKGNVFAPPSASLFSPVLHANILFSEMWSVPSPSAAELKQRADDAIFTANAGIELPPMYAVWPRYPYDEFSAKLPDPQVPVLVMNGTLDSQTPIETAEKVRVHYTGPNKHFIAVPNANHGVIINSPVPTGLPGELVPCGMKLVDGFMANQAAFDTSCTSQVVPPDFSRPPPEVQFFFGTTDMWNGNLVPPSSTPEPPSVALLRRAPHMFFVR